MGLCGEDASNVPITGNMSLTQMIIPSSITKIVDAQFFQAGILFKDQNSYYWGLGWNSYG